ncbi:MAG: endonuclease III [archaeon]
MLLSREDKIVALLSKEVGKTQAIIQFDNPFKVLISTILSQRTKDSNTAKASKNLFSRFSTPKTLAKASLTEIESLIKPSGFYKVKARYLKKVSQELIEKHNFLVPDNIQELTALTGVGHKTAACVMVYGFSKEEIPVDTHVARISQRLKLTTKTKPSEIWLDLKANLSRKHWLKLNELMVKFGQKKCFPRNPNCPSCSLHNYCLYFEENGLKHKL